LPTARTRSDAPGAATSGGVVPTANSSLTKGSDVRRLPRKSILEAGQTVEGPFKRLERGYTKDGDARAIAVIEIDGRERSVWLHEIALRGQLRDLRPEPNEVIRVTKGSEKKQSANGFAYWPFQVTAPDRPSEGVDWDSPLLGEGGESESRSDVPAETAGLGERSPDTPDDDIPF
jgi:hypothetical protein